jgi:predicted chitinase
MSYVKSLTPYQQANAKLITAKAKKRGITNGYAIGAMLAVASKEGELKPVSENLNYTAKRIMQVWPKTTPAKAAELSSDPVKLANFMYGGKYGNAPDEGFKFRGRGFNQITFKARYKQIGDMIGVDLVSNPDLLNQPDIAAEALVAYFQVLLKAAKIDPNKLTSTKLALDTIYQANAGKIGKPISDTTGGYAKAASRVDDLVEFVKGHAAATGGGIFFLTLLGVLIWKRKAISEAANKLLGKNK